MQRVNLPIDFVNHVISLRANGVEGEEMQNGMGRMHHVSYEMVDPDKMTYDLVTREDREDYHDDGEKFNRTVYKSAGEVLRPEPWMNKTPERSEMMGLREDTLSKPFRIGRINDYLMGENLDTGMRLRFERLIKDLGDYHPDLSYLGFLNAGEIREFFGSGQYGETERFYYLCNMLNFLIRVLPKDAIDRELFAAAFIKMGAFTLGFLVAQQSRKEKRKAEDDLSLDKRMKTE